MIEISTNDELQKAINAEIGSLLYFSTPTCNVCKALKPKIVKLFEEKFPKIKLYFIDASISRDIAASLNVFSVPTIIVYFEGKEFTRESRNISIDLFEQKIDRIYKLLTQ